jgi:hypothetical protein
MICYDDFAIVRRLPYWINWILIGVIYHLIVTVVFILIGSNVLPIARGILTIVVFSGLPIAIIKFRNQFPQAFQNLKDVINISEDFSLWIEKTTRLIFSLSNKSIIFTFLITDIIIIAVVLSLNLPYSQSEIILGILYLQPLVVIGGHAVHIAIRLVMFLYSVSHAELCVPFNMPSNLSIQSAYRYYSQISIVGFLIYGSHYLTPIVSGYALTVPIMIWMTFIGFFPFLLFTFSIFQIHVLMNRIKDFHIEQVNIEIQKVFEGLQEKISHSDAETLEVLMKIQKNLESSRVWPISVEGFLTLIITMLAPFIQLIVAIL